jgi:hypothetical protein
MMSDLTDVTDIRQRVERLQGVIEQAPQVECRLKHYFAPGVYVREMTVPAGVVATGAVHKTEHMTIVVGHCLLTTDDGARELRGHQTLVSKPGIKRAIVAIEETIVTTIHPTTTTDLDALVEELTESTAAELLGGKDNRQLLLQPATDHLENAS